jgi:PAS domain S-box-containing protein
MYKTRAILLAEIEDLKTQNQALRDRLEEAGVDRGPKGDISNLPPSGRNNSKAEARGVDLTYGDERHLNAILEATPDLVATVSRTIKFNYLNRACREFLALKEGVDVDRFDITSMQPKWAVDILQEQAFPATERDDVWQGETAILSPSGAEIPVSQVLIAHKSVAGEIEYFSTIIRDLSEYKHAQVALQESETRFRTMSDMSLTGISIFQNGGVKYVNPILASWLGYSVDELTAAAPLSLIHPDDRHLVNGYIRQSQKGEIIAAFTTRAIRKDGEEIYLEVLGHWITYDGQQAFIANELDVTERKKRDEELQRLNRTLRALIHSEHALIHAMDEKEYLHEVCRIMVEDCGHILAWIGFTQNDAEKKILPMTFAGAGEGLVEIMNLSWADTERGGGPTGIALRSGKPYICTDTSADPCFSLWRDEAVKRGLTALIVLPLMADGKPFGNLNIFSREPNPFTPEEVELLTTLANELVYGVQTLRLRAHHLQTEEDLQVSEARFHSLFEQMTEGFALHEIFCDDQGQPCDYRFLEVNPAFEHLTGLERDEIIGKCKSVAMPEDDPYWIQIYGKVAMTGEPIHFENYSHQLKQYYEVFAYSPAPRQFATLFMNITDRKKIEEDLHQSEEKYRSLYETMTQGVVYQDGQGRITSANPAAEKILEMSIDQMQGRTSMDPVWKAIHEDGTDFPGEEHPIVQAFRTGKMIKDVAIGMYISRTSGYRWVKVDAIPQFHPGEEKPYQVYAIFDDITQRKNMEIIMERHNRGLLRLNQMERELSPVFELNEILEKSLRTVSELIEIDQCRMWVWDKQQPGRLICGAVVGPFPEKTTIDLDSTELLNPSEDYDPFSRDLIKPLIRAISRASDCITTSPSIMIPLRIGEKINGVLEICNLSENDITHYDRIIIDSLVASTSMAIENVRLYDQSQQAAVLAERDRLARDLHDSVSQALFSASMIAEALPRLWDQKSDKVKDGLNQLHLLTRGALADMRSLLYELRPSTLLEIDLCDLLRMLVSATLSRSQISINLSIYETCFPSQDIKIAFYRIAQEALNNIVKHAGASTVTIYLHSKENGIEMCIRDDGQGFEKKRIAREHIGLEIMSERAEKNGIILSVQSKINHGTEVLAFWPGNDPVRGEKQ